MPRLRFLPRKRALGSAGPNEKVTRKPIALPMTSGRASGFFASAWSWAVGLAVAVFLAPDGYADALFERLTILDGLPGRQTFDIAQGADGFLWIADIQDGLIRYDGHEFRAYRHDPSDPESISSNEVTSVHVDRQGVLWVSTQNGLNRYDARTDNFLHITTKTSEPAGLSSDGVSFALVDSAQRLWVGTRDGLNRLDPGATKFRRYNVNHGYSGVLPRHNFFWTAFEDSSNRLWFGTLSGGLLTFDPTTDSLRQYVYDDTVDSPPIISVRSIAEDHQGQLWVAGDATLATLDPKTMKFTPVVLRRKEGAINTLNLPDYAMDFNSVSVDGDNHVWIATSGAGVIRILKDRRSRQLYRHDPNDRYSLGSNELYASFVDASGQVWIGGFDGLNRFNPLTEAVDYVNRPSHLPAEALIAYVQALPDNRLVAASGISGYWVIDLESNIWSELPWPRGSTSKTIHSIWVTNDGAVWVASPDNPKLFRLDPTLKQTRSYRPPDRPDSLYVDDDGMYWLGISIVGLVRLDPETGAMTTWRPDARNSKSLSHDMVWDAFEDGSGRFWVGTYRGLDLMDRDAGTFLHYEPDPERPDSLPAHDVRRIVQDEAGSLWVHTARGMSRYAADDDTFEHFPLLQSPIDVTEWTKHAPIAHGRLWWGSANGVASFDFKERRYFLYGPSEGITDKPDGLAAMPDGRLALALGDRIGLFGPDRIRKDTTVPKLALTSITLGKRTLDPSIKNDAFDLDATAWSATRLILRHDHQPVTFEFAALHFANSPRNKYKYKLEGIDNKWLETDSKDRRATYTTLPPGQYTLRVKAANPDGVWNEDGLAFSLTVLPPWWYTWWAFALYATALVLAFVAMVWFRTRTLHTRASELESQVATRTRELVEQKAIVESQAKHLEELVETKDRLMTRISHEFRTPLTVILGPIDRMHAEATSPNLQSYLAVTKRNASRLLRLVDQLLGLARLRSGHIESTRPVAAASIIRQVLASFESLAIERGLDLKLDRMENLTLQTTPDALEKITVNLVSNAIKYSAAGSQIRVSLNAGEGMTGILTVSDSGRGISPERLPHIFEPFERGHDEAERIPGSGLGLALLRELVTAHGGQVQVESTVGVGSVFRVFLPLAAQNAQPATVADEPSEEARVEVATLRAGVATASAAPPLPTSGARILVIEDNADMRSYLSQILSDTYHMTYAADGSEGLDMAATEIPDLVVCDVMLPGRDGFEVCHAIKTDDRTSHIPVILLTALADRADRLKGLKEKADDYLSKPFDEVELKQRIANLLDIRAVLQRRFARDLRFDETAPAGLSQRDQLFLIKLARVTASHHADPQFDLSRLASAMAVSERNLQRKLHALVGLTPGEYLRAYRLQRAIERLRAGERPGDVAFAVGFSSQAYFSTCFRAQFGFPPSETRDRMKQH